MMETAFDQLSLLGDSEQLYQLLSPHLEGKSKIIIMCGAGVSVPSGIPDYRSKDGLFSKFPDPSKAFNLQSFHGNPTSFFQVYDQLWLDKKYNPSEAHRFMKRLYDEGKLLKVYTQNIDGLELQAGIPETEVIQCHGHVSTARCTRKHCRTSQSIEEFNDRRRKGIIPSCNKCGRKTKPEIVFYGEDLPPEVNRYRLDFGAADLLLIMGTSLEVYPFAKFVDEVSLYTPRVLINMNNTASKIMNFDHSTKIRGNDDYFIPYCFSE